MYVWARLNVSCTVVILCSVRRCLLVSWLVVCRSPGLVPGWSQIGMFLFSSSVASSTSTLIRSFLADFNRAFVDFVSFLIAFAFGQFWINGFCLAS